MGPLGDKLQLAAAHLHEIPLQRLDIVSLKNITLVRKAESKYLQCSPINPTWIN